MHFGPKARPSLTQSSLHVNCKCTALGLIILTMSTSIAQGLFKSLPKPKHSTEGEELPQHAQPRGPRVVGADQLDETQVVLRVSFSGFFSELASELILSASENRPPTLRKPRRMATSSRRRFWRWWRVPRDLGCTVSP